MFESCWARQQVRLEDNFRSSRGVVHTARAFIEQNSDRLTKAMKPADAQADEPADIVALSFDSAELEGKYTAETIRELRGAAIKPSCRAA